MQKSSLHSKHEARNDSHEFDPQLDFAQFLKEAKTHVSQENSVLASEEGGRTKPKKSWKSSIFPWLKTEKKSSKTNVVEEQEPPLKIPYRKSKTIRGYVSGSVNGIKADKPKRSNSGPLLGLFNQRKPLEDDSRMPYITLGRLNNHRDLQSYGPVYLVT